MTFTLWERITGRLGRRYWLKRIDAGLHTAFSQGWLNSHRLHAIDAKIKYQDEATLSKPYTDSAPVRVPWSGPVESAPGAEWTCSRCGYANTATICTKCGSLPAPASPPAEPGTCPKCKGARVLVADTITMRREKCPACGGTGLRDTGDGDASSR